MQGDMAGGDDGTGGNPVSPRSMGGQFPMRPRGMFSPMGGVGGMGAIGNVDPRSPWQTPAKFSGPGAGGRVGGYGFGGTARFGGGSIFGGPVPRESSGGFGRDGVGDIPPTQPPSLNYGGGIPRESSGGFGRDGVGDIPPTQPPSLNYGGGIPRESSGGFGRGGVGNIPPTQPPSLNYGGGFGGFGGSGVGGRSVGFNTGRQFGTFGGSPMGLPNTTYSLPSPPSAQGTGGEELGSYDLPEPDPNWNIDNTGTGGGGNTSSLTGPVSWNELSYADPRAMEQDWNWREQNIQAGEQPDWFDEEWYVEQNPWAGNQYGGTPWEHYAKQARYQIQGDQEVPDQLPAPAWRIARQALDTPALATLWEGLQGGVQPGQTGARGLVSGIGSSFGIF